MPTVGSKADLELWVRVADCNRPARVEPSGEIELKLSLLAPQTKVFRMLHSVGQYISTKLSAGWDNVYWVMMEMDVMQWGILSVIFVIAGFMALRTRF